MLTFWYGWKFNLNNAITLAYNNTYIFPDFSCFYLNNNFYF